MYVPRHFQNIKVLTSWGWLSFASDTFTFWLVITFFSPTNNKIVTTWYVNYVVTIFYPAGYKNMTTKSKLSSEWDKWYFMYIYTIYHQKMNNSIKNTAYFDAICCNNLLWQFVMTFCSGILSWQFVVTIFCHLCPVVTDAKGNHSESCVFSYMWFNNLKLGCLSEHKVCYNSSEIHKDTRKDPE